MSGNQESDTPDIRRRIGAEDYSAFLAEVGDRTRFQVDFAQAALKNLHLVNGGGIIALLTLIGNSKVTYDSRSIWWAFVWFGTGLIFSLAAYFGAYFSQNYFMNTTAMQAWNAQAKAHGLPDQYEFRQIHEAGNIALFAALGCASASLLFFIVGAFVALGGIL